MSDSPEQENKKGLFSFFSRNKSEQPSPVDSEEQSTPQESAASETVIASEDVASSAEMPVSETSEEAQDQSQDASQQVLHETSQEVQQEVPQEKPQSKPGFFDRLRNGLKRTRGQLAEGLGDLFLGKKAIDDDLLEELETQLLIADVGIEATQEIIKQLTDQVSRKDLKDSGALFSALQDTLTNLLEPIAKPLEIDSSHSPYVILMVGVNGVGKTTTIGKLAKQFQQQGKSVMLAAGDTFRAAAVEQLQVWGERNEIPVIAQQTGADSASVIYDAVSAAKARNADILIADTAGRLHTRDNLMDELAKVKRVMAKLDETAPHEVMLVLDAGTGQNAINQAKQFHEAMGLTGLTFTKLDGTAKGGVLFAIAKQLGIPVRYIGVGEQIDDLRVFDHKDFVSALFDGIQIDADGNDAS